MSNSNQHFCFKKYGYFDRRHCCDIVIAFVSAILIWILTFILQNDLKTRDLWDVMAILCKILPAPRKTNSPEERTANKLVNIGRSAPILWADFETTALENVYQKGAAALY